MILIMSNENILTVKNLIKDFVVGKEHKRVLNGVSFAIGAGECVGLVGKSGCGKSTVARTVARLTPADGGEIILAGEDITAAKGRKLAVAYGKMQMIFQSPEDSFDPKKTLGWSLGEGLRNRGFDKQRIKKRIDELLNEVGLSPTYRKRYPHQVSGGECQRAAVVRAVALSPKLLLCDEATSALDVMAQAQVTRLIRRFTKELNIACLFITHDLALLPSIADRVMVMDKGEIVETGKTDEIIGNPRTEAAKELLAADFFRGA